MNKTLVSAQKLGYDSAIKRRHLGIHCGNMVITGGAVAKRCQQKSKGIPDCMRDKAVESVALLSTPSRIGCSVVGLVIAC